MRRKIFDNFAGYFFSRNHKKNEIKRILENNILNQNSILYNSINFYAKIVYSSIRYFLAIYIYTFYGILIKIGFSLNFLSCF